jgi:hypothetical protein
MEQKSSCYQTKYLEKVKSCPIVLQYLAWLGAVDIRVAYFPLSE